MAIEKKLQLESHAFRKFQKKFAEGAYHGQRFGQAFYDHFQMHRVISKKDALDRIYNLDGNEALTAIKALIKFN